MIPGPEWVDSGAEQISGLDLLGLRLPVQNIGYRLLDGVTSVTPQVRYLSYVSWIVERYRNSGLPDQSREFYRFAAGVEAAFVMANLVHDANTPGLVGPIEGRKRLSEEGDQFSLESLVQNAAVSIYANVSMQLNLTFPSATGILGLTEERGYLLAQEFERIVGGTAYSQRLRDDPTIGYVTRDELRELGGIVALSALTATELEILIDALFPAAPFPSELPRLESLSLFLSLARQSGMRVTESMIFDAAHTQPSDLPPEINNVLANWLQYSVRDLIAVANEVAFEAVSSEALKLAKAAEGPTTAAAVLNSLTQYSSLFDNVLRDIALIAEAESAAHLSFNDLYDRVNELCEPIEISDKGLHYWTGSLSEHALIKACLNAGPGGVILLPVAYCVAYHRAEPMLQGEQLRSEFLAHRSWARIGLVDVIAPTIEELREQNPNLISAALTLAHRSVDQHMRIAWSRAGNDLKRDVSVFTIEGDKWFPRKQFYGGQTISRLNEALGWLDQLSLIDENGLTDSGERILERSLGVLKEHGR